MTTAVRNDHDRSRYEIRVDDELIGIAEYRVSENLVVMPHTEIVPRWRELGYGEQLVRAALDDIRAAGRTVRPLCWYVAEFIDNNPSYADLLDR